jgi:hypothetical protein
MKKTILGIVFFEMMLMLLTSPLLKAQNDSSLVKEKKAPAIQPCPYCFTDPKLRTVDAALPIGNRSFRRIIAQLYSNISTGQGQTSNPLSSGSFDPVAGTFQIAYAQELKISSKNTKDSCTLPADTYCNTNPDDLKSPAPKSWFLNISAGGGVTSNNIGVLFNNSKFNSGVNVTGKLLIPINNSIMLDGPARKVIVQKKIDLEYKRWNEKKKIWNTINSPAITDNIRDVEAHMKKDALDIDAAKKDLDAVSTLLKQQEDAAIKEDPSSDLYKKIAALRVKLADSLLGIRTNIDSLSRSFQNNKRRVDSMSNILNTVMVDEYNASHPDKKNWPDADLSLYGKKLYDGIDSFCDHQIDSAEINGTITPFCLKWLTLVGQFKKNNYYTYFDSLAFASQITSNTFSAFNFGLEFDLVRYNPKAIHYVTIGLLRVRDNNVGDLTTSPITRQVNTSSGDTAQSASETYNAYTTPIVEYKAWKPYVNYYLFLGKASKFGFHSEVDAEFRDTKVNPMDLTLGYVFSFKNSKDNSVINIEAYIKFQDLFKSLPDQAAYFYNRNTIGILFGIPINLPTK